MSGVITIGFGQCGCSVIDELLAQLYLAENCEDLFFHEVLTTRSILVDTESKAIDTCVRSRRSWSYNPTNLHVLGQGGAGNNWANGYCLGGGGQVIIDSVRREAERCDRLDSICVVSSAAGGTGSGLGCRLTEEIRDMLPRSPLINTVVCPYSVGEVAVQNYNSALSLANLLEVSDGVVLIENERVNKTCTSLLKIAQPSFSDLNSVIAQHLSGFLLPSSGTHNMPSQRFAHLTRNPTYKFLTSRMVPSVPKQSIAFSNDSWAALNKRLYQMHVSDAFLESDIDWSVSIVPTSRSIRAPNKSLANVLTLHGDGAKEALNLPEARLFEHASLYPTWSDGALFCHRPQRFNAHPRSSTLLSNSQAAIRPVDVVASRGHNMFTSRAYAHQYLRFGLEVDDFIFAFSRLEQALFDYREL